MRIEKAPDETAAPPESAFVGNDKAKLTVFVSYSHQDLVFADQLVAALDAFGFSTTIDRKGIYGAENWQRRLGQLILESDTVVFVLTPAAAVSSVCRWEVEQALELNKRIVPILASPLGDAEPHGHLCDLNYIYFYAEPRVPESGFGKGLASLVDTLSVNVEWMREHTRLGGLVAQWQAGNRPADLLSRGSELLRLQQWRDTRPANTQELTPLQRAFLQASEDAETARCDVEQRQIEERELALKQVEAAQDERARAIQKLSRRTKYGLLGMSLLTILSILASAFVYEQNQALQITRAGLRRSMPLAEGMKLKIADTDHMVTATDRWNEIATDYKLAIGVYRARPRDWEKDSIGTGFLVKGGSLRAEWTDQVVFVTASSVVRPPHKAVAPDFSQAYVIFPGIDRAAHYRVEEILFESAVEDLDVAVLSLADVLPAHAEPIDLASQIEAKDALGGVAVLQFIAPDGYILGFGHGIARPDGRIGTLGDRMYYTYVTGVGAIGAPVFDAASGNVVCVHNGDDSRPPRPFGYCTSMTKIVTAIGAR